MEDADEATAAFYYLQTPGLLLDGVPVAVEWAQPLDDMVGLSVCAHACALAGCDVREERGCSLVCRGGGVACERVSEGSRRHCVGGGEGRGIAP